MNVHNNATMDRKKISMNHFLKERSSYRDLDESANQYIQEICKCEKICLEVIQTLRQSIDAIISKLRLRVKNHFAETISAIKLKISATEKLTAPTFNLQQQTNPQATIEKFRKELQIYFTNIQCHQLLQQESINAMAKQQELEVAMSQSAEVILASTKTALEQVGNIFDFEPREESSSPVKKHTDSSKIGWSSSLKYSDLEIQDNQVRRVKESKPGYVCILVDKELKDSQSDKYTWQIKIMKKQSQIGVGICLESKAKSLNFIGGQWESEGHGNYIVGSAGFTYSSSDMNINGKQMNYKFTTGDIIELMYTTVNNRLILRKNYSYVFEFNVKQASQGDVYRPCLYFLGVNDSVKLITQ